MSLLQERSQYALNLGESIFRFYLDLKAILKSTECDGHLGLLRLKLSMYKLVQKFGKSLLDNKMLVEL